MISAIAFAILAAAPSPAFTEPEPGIFAFETEAIRGRLRADGKLQGIAQLVDKESGVDIVNPKFPGILALYRLLSPGKRLGDARILPHSARLADGGRAVAIDWKPTDLHPVRLGAVFRIADARAIDLEISCAPEATIPAYEVFISSYPILPMKPFLFVRKALHQDGPDRPILLAPVSNPFIDGCYLAFPRDYADAAHYFDGRWLTDPNPVHIAIGHHYAEPIIGARDPRTGLAIVLMAERKDCFGLVSAYDREPLDGIADHNSIYLNLNGRDAKPGETLRFRIRARIGRLADPAEALEIYRGRSGEASTGSPPRSGRAQAAPPILEGGR